ncbi:MGF 360-1L [African swine fever virus]|uniref:MGF 360-1L n=1 Tax=African swine fever virus TaxID=10497 RepID=A0A0C5AZ90_ASF|nr:MGF 360-1L [African swine fever virus]AJL34005.1 MGF 360-1L [African swine fever virus]
MPTPSSLQALTKKVLATQHISKEYSQSREYCHILKCCGLWWHGGPIMLSTNDEDHQMIKSVTFKDGLEINLALMKAVQENNYNLIKLFTEWGANINFGLATANTECTWNFCRKLGAKKTLGETDAINIFCKVYRIKSSSNIIICHELLSNNFLFLNIDILKTIIYWDLEKISINFILDDVSFSEKLTRFWYALAVRYNYTEAIQYFYQRYKHFKDWRLICGLSFNNVYDFHEMNNIKKIDMSINDMMYLSCTRDSNFLTIYYCFVLGVDINLAMIISVKLCQITNIFFCIDLGATAFEECLEIAKRKNDNILVKILSFKNYSPESSLLSLKTTDPEKIKVLLENYKTKSMLLFIKR